MRCQKCHYRGPRPQQAVVKCHLYIRITDCDAYNCKYRTFHYSELYRDDYCCSENNLSPTGMHIYVHVHRGGAEHVNYYRIQGSEQAISNAEPPWKFPVYKIYSVHKCFGVDNLQ